MFQFTTHRKHLLTTFCSDLCPFPTFVLSYSSSILSFLFHEPVKSLFQLNWCCLGAVINPSFFWAIVYWRYCPYCTHFTAFVDRQTGKWNRRLELFSIHISLFSSAFLSSPKMNNPAHKQGACRLSSLNRSSVCQTAATVSLASGWRKAFRR